MTEENLDEIATFEWLESRAWRIRGDKLTGHFAVLPCGTLGNLRRYIVVDKIGVSMSLRSPIQGPPGQSNEAPVSAIPLARGMPTRKFILDLEIFSLALP